MILTLQRLNEITEGGLYIDGHWECFTLEDKDRHLETGGVKIPKETAIPRGKYKVVIDWSDRFKCLMLHVLGVPQFDGIRVHTGFSVDSTEGCIIVGQERDVNKPGTILKSVAALKILTIELLNAMLNGEDVWISIE